MSSQAGRGLRPGGVVRALIRLLFLVVFGFGAGLLFGIVSEEPELLAGHLRGESQSIVLTTDDVAMAMAETLAGPGEANARGGHEEDGGRALPSVAASGSTTRPTDSQTPGQGSHHSASPSAGDGSSVEDVGAWAIQVGAFSEEGAALRLAESLRAKGYPTELLSAQGDAGRWRVRVQPMSGETTARETAARLKRIERLPTWVLRMETS